MNSARAAFCPQLKIPGLAQRQRDDRARLASALKQALIVSMPPYRLRATAVHVQIACIRPQPFVGQATPRHDLLHEIAHPNRKLHRVYGNATISVPTAAPVGHHPSRASRHRAIAALRPGPSRTVANDGLPRVCAHIVQGSRAMPRPRLSLLVIDNVCPRAAVPATTVLVHVHGNLAEDSAKCIRILVLRICLRLCRMTADNAVGVRGITGTNEERWAIGVTAGVSGLREAVQVRVGCRARCTTPRHGNAC